MTPFEEAQTETRRRAAPALHIVRCSDSRRSKIGGLPEAPDGFDWPAWKGQSLSFLAQIDLGEVANAGASHWLPTDGRLYFFYDREQSTWGFDPADRGSWRVLYVGPQERSIELRAPADLAPDAVFPSCPVNLRRITSYPDMQRLEADTSSLTEEEFEQLIDTSTAAFEGQPHHQLFGYPCPIQGDGMELECQLASNGVYCGSPDGYSNPQAQKLESGAQDWRLLLQLDSDDDASMMWGDVGTLYFWVRENEARAGNFENVWMVLQCS